MGMSSGSSRGGLKNDINVTPMVDIVLVLLIIFMVVTPMLQRGKDVKLPQARSVTEKKSAQDADPLIVSVTRDGQVYLENDEYDHPNLRRKLREELGLSPGRKVLLKGDVSLDFGKVREIMDLARHAGARGVALGVEELKEN
jgi:biopolymer transport protein TolR